METHAQARTPFFLYYPMTQIHFPTLRASGFRRQDRRRRHRRCDGRDGRQRRTRARRASTGWGSRRNTIVLWCTDNGAEQRRPWRGSSGPWSGFYNTRDGRRHPHAVHHPLAGPDSGRARVERDRPRDGYVPDARGGRRRRHRAEGSRDRRRQPAAVPRGQAGRSPIANHVLFFTNADSCGP